MGVAYTLDDAHETLAYLEYRLRWAKGFGYPLARTAESLEALEADLPEPCEHCGSDQCAKLGEADPGNVFTCDFLNRRSENVHLVIGLSVVSD